MLKSLPEIPISIVCDLETEIGLLGAARKKVWCVPHQSTHFSLLVAYSLQSVRYWYRFSISVDESDEPLPVLLDGLVNGRYFWHLANTFAGEVKSSLLTKLIGRPLCCEARPFSLADEEWNCPGIRNLPRGAKVFQVFCLGVWWSWVSGTGVKRRKLMSWVTMRHPKPTWGRVSRHQERVICVGKCAEFLNF